jgi:hypothetical protein
MAGQRSPLFEFAVSRVPRIVAQYVAANIRILLITFKEIAGSYFFGSHLCVTSNTFFTAHRSLILYYIILYYILSTPK